MKEILLIIVMSILFAAGMNEIGLKSIVLRNEHLMPQVVGFIIVLNMIMFLLLYFLSRKTGKPMFYKEGVQGSNTILNRYLSAVAFYVVIFQLVALIVVSDYLGGAWYWVFRVGILLIIVGSAIPKVID